MNSPAPMLTRISRIRPGAVRQPEHDQHEERLLEQAVVGGAEELRQEQRQKAPLPHQGERVGFLAHHPLQRLG